MACDNLRPGTFNDAMKSIRQSYEDLMPAWKEMKNITDTMKKEHWHTPKGYEEVNKFANGILTCVNSCFSVIHNNYNEIKRSAREFADKEKMSISVSAISQHKIARIDDQMGDTEDGFIDDTALGSDSTPVKEAKDKILDCLDAIRKVTADPATLGYWSTGSNDPREAINNAVVKMKNRVKQIIDTFNDDLWDKVQTDKADREEAKKGQYQDFGE